MKKFEWKTIKTKVGNGRKKFIAVTVVLCLVAAAAGGAITHTNRSNAEENKVVSSDVDTGTIKESVSGTGSISYASTTDIVLPTQLEMKEILVSEGTYVNEGDLLATVDETSLAVCICDVEEAIEELDSTITSKYSSSTTSQITAGVSGTVEKIYGAEGDDVADVMMKNGALMLIKKGDETIKVIGSEGTISSVNVAEGDTVSASTKVFKLDSSAQSGDYLKAVKDREELVAILNNLLSIRKNGGVVAGMTGMVEVVNVTGTASNTTSDTASDTASGTASGTASDKLSQDVSEEKEPVADQKSSVIESAKDSALNSEEYEDTAVNSQQNEDTAIHEIEAVTIRYFSAAVSGDSGTVIPDVLKNLKVEAGKIVGTTTDMEYADSETADTWVGCNNEYTEVSKGTWYVRLKGTESPGPAVKVEVTEDIPALPDGGNSVQNGNGQTENGQNTGSQTGVTQTENGKADTGNQAAVENVVENAAETSKTNGSSSDNKNSNDAGDGEIPGDISTQGTSSKSSSAGNGKSASGMGSVSFSNSGGSGDVTISGSSSSSVSTVDNSGISTECAFTIANGDKMVVTMNVDELDILSMQEGLAAEITLDAIENKTFEGTITNVSQSASGSNGSTQYPVEITFDKTEEMLSGMNASVAVIIKQAENVLTIPLVAVEDEGRSSYVYTGYDEASGELTGKTEVTLGMSDENSVEVKEGLSDGDTVYYEITEGSSEKSSGKDAMGGMGIPDMSNMPDMSDMQNMPGGSDGSGRPSFPSGGFGDRPQ